MPSPKDDKVALLNRIEELEKILGRKKKSGDFENDIPVLDQIATDHISPSTPKNTQHSNPQNLSAQQTFERWEPELNKELDRLFIQLKKHLIEHLKTSFIENHKKK